MKNKMAGVVVRSLGSSRCFHSESWTRNHSSRFRKVPAVLLGFFGTAGGIFYFLEKSVRASEFDHVEPPSYPWRFEKLGLSFDHAALRRGWQVYKAVCFSCHSLQYVRFLDFVDVTHTKSEVEALAEEYEVQDGPNEEGEYYMRPGKLLDFLPKFFANEEAARAANLGAYPPDLTFQVPSIKNGTNYTYALLTGYFEDVPAGIEIAPTRHFNAYFAGNTIGMPEILQDGIVEYEDGTPATKSQMAKDVVEFLSWTSEQGHDARQVSCIKGLIITCIGLIVSINLVKRTWTFVRSKQIFMIPKPKW
ncbi:uncharacterized protein [Prorops nasuta]|uniref:uncharacterized protein n=1 Tax=Prorops nasuta TaxID=863751 RepID=UPI0034CE6965